MKILNRRFDFIFTFLLLLAIVTQGPILGAETRSITEMDLFKFVWVADPQISPDGARSVPPGQHFPCETAAAAACASRLLPAPPSPATKFISPRGSRYRQSQLIGISLMLSRGTSPRSSSVRIRRSTRPWPSVSHSRSVAFLLEDDDEVLFRFDLCVVRKSGSSQVSACFGAVRQASRISFSPRSSVKPLCLQPSRRVWPNFLAGLTCLA